MFILKENGLGENYCLWQGKKNKKPSCITPIPEHTLLVAIVFQSIAAVTELNVDRGQPSSFGEEVLAHEMAHVL